MHNYYSFKDTESSISTRMLGKYKQYSHSVIKLVFGLVLVCAFFIVTNKQIVNAANPQIISFQGKVVNADGTNVANGSYNFDFVLYDDASLGTPSDGVHDKWHELTKSVTVTNGVFQTNLGSATALPDFNAYPTLYLAVRFNADAAGYMTPRVRMASVPYALNSDTVGGVAASSLVQLGATQSGNINIGAGTITSGMINSQTLNSTAVTFDSTAFSIDSTTASNLTVTGSGQNLTVSVVGGGSQELILSSAGTGVSAINIDATAGGLTLDVLASLSIDVTGATGASNISVAANADAEDLTIETTGSAGDLIFNSADQITFDGATATSLIFSDYTTDANAVLYTSTTGVLTRVVETETAGLCLTSGAGASGVPIWGSCGGGGGYALIQDEGSDLTVRTTLNFTGAGVTCTDNGGNARTDCTVAGGSGSDLQGTYDGGSAGDQVITLDGTQDSIVVRNPSSSGSDSAFTFKIEQLNTGAATSGLYIDNRGTGNTLQLDDVSADTTPLIVDANGRLGIGTTSIIGSTERLLQVGSPTERGNAAVYGDIVSQGISDITALTNIQDIYVYDTTADSDGGRWIDWATTDQLSWYNESLDDSPSDPCNISTDDRCYSKSFPRKAILVVTTDALYIFDAATNDMWMKFSQHSSGYAIGVDTNNDPSSVTALNGVIYVGTKGTSAGGLYAFDFTQDRMWNYDTTDRSGADTGIAGRNGAVTYNSDNNTALDLGTTGTVAEWGRINDVSAANITGSKTASTTGAATNTSPGGGNTFVGLATDAGVTIINLATQKLIQYSDAADQDYTSLQLTRRGTMYALNTSSDQLEKWNNYDTDKANEIAGAPDVWYDEAAHPALWPTAPNILTNAPDALEVVELGSLDDSGLVATGTSSDLIYVGHSLGLTEIHDHATTASNRSTNAWVKYFDTTRQSAMMIGGVDTMLMLDDASGSIAEDASRNDVDLSYINAPTLGVSGVRGKAVSFNNTDEYICSDADENGTCDIDTAFNMSTTGFTLNLWFKHSTTVGAVDILFEKCVTAAPAQAIGCVAAYMTASGTMQVAIDDDATWTRGSSYDITATSSLTYNDNQWHMLTLVRDNANDMNAYIDGNPLNLSNATGLTTTVDGSQIVTFGAGCGTAAGLNCAAANTTNHWDGAIDDIMFANSTTTISQLTAAQVRRIYNDARPLVNKRVVTVDNATTATSTTIGDSGETWIPNEFAGMIVTLTSGTGAGQTRRVVSNTDTTITVSSSFDTTPDTTTDFEVDPEALIGSTNSVYAIGITGEAPIGEARQMCVGTNDSSDGGAVTCFNHQAGPNLIADTFHSDSAQFDDYSVEWTGTDYDDIRSIDLSGRVLVIGSEAHMYAETRDVRLGQGLDYLANQLFNIRSEILNDAISATGSLSGEVAFTGGADLAENYASLEGLVSGDVVSLEPNIVGSVKKSSVRYQNDLIGVVSTVPGVVLGPIEGSSYPIALSGRVPVNVTTENGPIKTGDRVTSSSTPGYAMKAVNAGRVLGTVLDDFTEDKYVDCPEDTPEGTFCGQVTIFVNLVDYNGESVEIAMDSAEDNGMLWDGSFLDSIDGLAGLEAGMTELQASVRQAQLAKADKILRYLAGRQTGEEGESEVLVDRISANEINGADIYAGNIFASTLTVDKIHANQIEGLEIFTDQIKSLSEKLAAEQAQNENVDNEEDSEQNENQATEEPIISTIDISNVTFQSATISLNLNVMGTLTASGALVVNGDATFNGLVDFAGRVTFNNDSGGFAVIRATRQDVDVVFTEPFDTSPSVSLTVKNGRFVKYSYEEIKEESEESSNYGKVIGIRIMLEQAATTDIEFSWTAMSIRDPKIANPEP